MQRALRAIDAAPDRSKALASATASDPRLRGFFDEVLLAIGKAERRAGGVVEFTG